MSDGGLKKRLDALREEKGGMLRSEDVEQEDLAKLVSMIFKDSKRTGDAYRSWLEVFTLYGIVCPHPQHKILYEGKHRLMRPTAEFRWFDCEMCGCSAINEFWLRKTLETKKADDRRCEAPDRRTSDSK